MEEEKIDYEQVSLVYKEDEENKIEKVYVKKYGNHYQIKGVPAFANNVAYNDIISVEYEDGQLFFDELIEASGHSVVHVAILKSENSALFFTNLILFNIGINYLHNNLYLVIDVPKTIYYKDLRDFLIRESEIGNIDVSESCVSELHFATIKG